MLTTEQQDFYDQNGYLMVENVITKDQLNKLQAITYEFIEASRNIQENDDVFDLDEKGTVRKILVLRALSCPINKINILMKFSKILA